MKKKHFVQNNTSILNWSFLNYNHWNWQCARSCSKSASACLHLIICTWQKFFKKKHYNLFGKVREQRKKQESEWKWFFFSSLLHKWLQCPGLRQGQDARSFFQVSYLGFGDSCTWAIFCCFFLASSKQLDQKWGNWYPCGILAWQMVAFTCLNHSIDPSDFIWVVETTGLSRMNGILGPWTFLFLVRKFYIVIMRVWKSE